MNAQIKVDQDGNVGIKNLSPKYGLDIHATNIRFDNWSDLYFDWNEYHGCPTFYPERNWYFQLGYRDNRVGTMWAWTIHSFDVWQDGAEGESKAGFEPLTNSLSKLAKINGVKYTFPDNLLEGLPLDIKEQLAKERFGLVTDEIEQYFPQLIFKDSSGNKMINYTRLIPVLVEAIKQQQKEIEFLYSLNGGASFKNSSEVTGKTEKEKEIIKLYCKLYQNSPNPFNKTTVIKYELSSAVSNAAIYIFNMEGKLLKTYNIGTTGVGSVTVKEGELMPGMYFYTLVANGKEIDTKKMLLTD